MVALSLKLHPSPLKSLNYSQFYQSQSFLNFFVIFRYILVLRDLSKAR